MANLESREWKGEKFWQKVDRLFAYTDSPWFLMGSILLLLTGVLLGIVAQYL